MLVQLYPIFHWVKKTLYLCGLDMCMFAHLFIYIWARGCEREFLYFIVAIFTPKNFVCTSCKMLLLSLSSVAKKSVKNVKFHSFSSELRMGKKLYKKSTHLLSIDSHFYLDKMSDELFVFCFNIESKLCTCITNIMKYTAADIDFV